MAQPTAQFSGIFRLDHRVNSEAGNLTDPLYSTEASFKTQSAVFVRVQGRAQDFPSRLLVYIRCANLEVTEDGYVVISTIAMLVELVAVAEGSESADVGHVVCNLDGIVSLAKHTHEGSECLSVSASMPQTLQ